MLDRESKRIAEGTTTYPSWLLGSERVQEVVPVEGHPGACEYRTYQAIEGVAAYYLLLTTEMIWPRPRGAVPMVLRNSLRAIRDD